MTSYGQKKGWESNCQFDSWKLKVNNRFDFFAFRWRAMYYWKALDKGYNFAWPHLNWRFTHKVMGCESRESFNFGNFGTPIRVPRQNDIWVLVLCLGTKNIRRKVVASPKSGSSWILWICVCLWFVRAPKMLQLCTY